MPNTQNFSFIVSSWWKFGQCQLVFYQILVFTDAAPRFFLESNLSFFWHHPQLDRYPVDSQTGRPTCTLWHVFFPSVRNLTNNRNHNQILVDSDCYWGAFLTEWLSKWCDWFISCSKWQLCHHSIPFGPLFWCQIVVEDDKNECKLTIKDDIAGTRTFLCIYLHKINEKTIFVIWNCDV